MAKAAEISNRLHRFKTNMPKKNYWTEENLAILRKHFATMPSGDIADMIGCTDVTVRNKAKELGLKKDKSFRKINYYGRYSKR